MVARAVVFIGLVGCAFRSGTALVDDAPRGDGPGRSDARRFDGKPLDAKVFLDAKVYMDAPATVAGSLVVTRTAPESGGDINLTTEGTADWAHWAMNSPSNFDHKSGANLISNLTPTPGAGFAGSPVTASWTDGTPDTTASATSSGAPENQGASYTFTAPADQSPRTLRVYVVVQNATGKLDVSLSDSSATAYSNSVSTGNTENVKYTIVYNAATNGKHLTVTWSDTNDGNGNPSALVGLMSATLQ